MTARLPYGCLRCGFVNLMGTTTCQSCGHSLIGTVANATQMPTGRQVRQPSSTGGVPAPPPAVVQPPAAGSPPMPSGVLALLGWTTLDGRVVQAEPVYLADADYRWGRLCAKLAIFAIILYFSGRLLFVALLVAGVLGWLLSRLFRGGFLSAVAIQVTSFFLTRRLFGSVATTPVRDVRVRDAAGQETLVRIKGQLVTGSVAVGDDVSIAGWNRGGMMLFRRGYNSRVRSAIRVKHP